MPEKSPLAPEKFPDLPAIKGLEMAAGVCNVRYVNKTDVLFASFAPGTTAAGVFTKSKTAAAPIDWCRKCLEGGEARGLVVNSGNANAFTGRAGVEAVEAMASTAAGLLGCASEDIFIAQTGVIGEPVAVDKITENLPGLQAQFAQDWESAADAIMTTDTFPKGAAAVTEINGTEITITGIAKGSGMIAPDMATMLAFIFTDAKLPADVLQPILADVTNKSFNAITVDSDTSTSDTLILFATGQAGNGEITSVDDPELEAFKMALGLVCVDLAHQIVRDGEGATKFVEIQLTGAEDDAAAKTIGLSIANSPLVKTAIAGEDANWGRIVMAVGKSGEAADRDKLELWLGSEQVTADGAVVPTYSEARATAHLQQDEVQIRVDVGVGEGHATVWTCDLTHGYIEINAGYRS